MNQVLDFLVLGVTRGSMYALIALGYTLVYGVLQLINFAHGEVFMFGAFGSYLVVSNVAGAAVSSWEVPLLILLGVAAGGLAGAGVAWCLERVAYRPLRRRGAPRLAFLISAIGASFFLSTFASKMFNSQTTNQFPEFFDFDATLIEVSGVHIRVLQVLIVGSAVTLMVCLDRLVHGTKFGKSMRAVSQDPETASLMGIDIDRTISRTFVIGGLLGGVAGFLFGIYFSFAYNMGFIPGIKAFAAAVLGGIGNIRGAMLGGLLLGVIENLVLLLPSFDARWTDVVAFVVLVAVLMFRPSGILGGVKERTA